VPLLMVEPAPPPGQGKVPVSGLPEARYV
jgi:hypothetical protein